MEVDSLLKGGPNHLEIRVVNAWHNRLVGERRQPEAFQGPGLFRPWAPLIPKYKPNEPLLPAGLLGPVTLRSERVVRIHDQNASTSR
jgi:hypothetical protein